MVEEVPFRSGFVALIGRPNSGKSTLLNAILGQGLSPVTPVPQTTRRSIKGIYTTDNLQIVFTDTPGIHKGKYHLNDAMLREAEGVVRQSRPDCVAYCVDLSRDFGDEESIVAHIAISSGAPVLVVFNKKDLCRKARARRREFVSLYPELAAAPSVVLSAKEPDARERMITALQPFIHEGPRYFDDDTLTDANMRFFAAEYLRKQLLLATREEVPHAVFVEIESYREEKERHVVAATIHVETTGQRGIVIGEKGQLLAKITRAAEQEMRQLAGCPVEISCHVKVTPHWRDNKVMVDSAFSLS
jgi:GTP-binding protein Era